VSAEDASLAVKSRDIRRSLKIHPDTQAIRTYCR